MRLDHDEKPSTVGEKGRKQLCAVMRRTRDLADSCEHRKKQCMGVVCVGSILDLARNWRLLGDPCTSTKYGSSLERFEE